ncbi:MAG TPA: PAS domain S-box protein [Leptospiraceae bacterium]|nr:PAS domain S-box protein [Leptospiraceae bacterium]
MPDSIKNELFRILKEDESVISFMNDFLGEGMLYLSIHYPDQEWSPRRFHKILGHYSSDKENERFFQENYPDFYEKVRAKLFFLETSPSEILEDIYIFEHSAGGKIWMLGKGIKVRGTGGGISGILLGFTEIDREEKELKRLINENQKLKAVLTALEESSLVSVTDNAGIILSCNRKFCEISKYREEELIGKKHSIVNSGYHSKEFWKNMWDTVRKGGVWQGEVCNRSKDGTFYWVDSVIAPIYDETGSISNFISVRHDITDRKELEKILKNTEKKMSSLTENFPDGSVSLLNLNLDFLYTAGSGFKRNNIDPAEFNGKNASEVLNISLYEALCSHLPEIRKGISVRYEVPYEDRLFLNMCEPVYNEKNEVSSFVIVARDITDYKSTVSQLAERETAHRIIDRLPALIGYWNRNLINLFANAAYKDWFGLDSSAIRGRHIRDIIGEERYRQNLPYMEKALQGEAQIFERVIPSPDEKILRSALAYYLPDISENEVQGFYVLVTDISSIKPGSWENKRIQEMLEETSQVGKIGVWEYDLENDFLYWSNTARQIYEVSYDYVPSRVRFILFCKNTDNRNKIQDAFHKAVDGGKSWDMELLIVTGLKKEKWIRVTGNTEIRKGVPVRLYGTIQDIHEKKVNEIRMMTLASIAEHSNDAVIAQDLENRVISWNRGAERIFGYSEEEIIGESITKIIPVDRIQEEKFIFDETLSGRILNHYETVRLDKKGNEIYVSITASPLMDTENRIIGVSKISRNISEKVRILKELKDAKTAAEQASKVKSEFLANMSHEMRTPLNGVMGFSDLLLSTKLDSLQKYYVNTILQSSEFLLGIINDILDISKIEAGKLEIYEEVCDLVEICKFAADTVRTQSESKELELSLHIDPDLTVSVFADSFRLKQILINLLGNAVKFTESGTVELDLKLLNRMDDGEISVRFSIMDTGLGIDPKNQERIFEAFYQADLSSVRKFGGAGLGLTISSRILSLMDSSLKVRSELGRGSTFYFDLKMKTSPEKNQFEKSMHISPYSLKDMKGTGLTILAAEDNRVNMSLICRILKSILPEAIILEAVNGAEALRISEKFKLDLIFMDLHMPELDGFSASERIRQSSKGTDVPIIALTASTVREEMEKAFLCGINEFCTKPVVRSDIEKILLKWLFRKGV